MYINTNVAALFAQNSLNQTQMSLNKLQQQMSTGNKINSPADNPSGLAISNLMQGEIGGINAAVNNATQANNLLNVANGGMQTDVQIVQEIQQLAVQASNSTNNLQDTQDIQNQIKQLLTTLDNVGNTLNYNNQQVLGQGATGGSPALTSSDQAAISSASTAFVSKVTDASVALGSYTVAANYNASYSLSYATTGFKMTMTDANNAFSVAGTYSVVASVAASVSGVKDTTVTLELTNKAGSVIGKVANLAVASTAIGTAGTSTAHLDGMTVSVQLGSLAYASKATDTASVTGAYTVTATVSSGGTAIGHSVFSQTTTAALKGNFTFGVSGATVGLTLGSIAAAGPGKYTQDFTVTSPLHSLQVGADSGNLSAGLYTVSMYYASTAGNSSGVDYVTITGPNGYNATGSVSNLSNTTGTLSLQLVSGNNMSGNNSFVLNVNQTDVQNSSSASPIVQSVSVAAAQTYTFQTGPNQGNGNAISLGFGSFNSATLGLSNIDVRTTQGAQYAITQAQRALSMLTNAQGQVGAQVDQLNYTISNLQTQTTNLQSSQSSIKDANMAQVTSQFAQEQILMQTGIQALQTSQQLPSLVLKLLG